jgi:hypothetical protein
MPVPTFRVTIEVVAQCPLGLPDLIRGMEIRLAEFNRTQMDYCRVSLTNPAKVVRIEDITPAGPDLRTQMDRP